MFDMQKYKTMSDEELHDLALTKDAKGRYTLEANLAQAERRLRSGIIQYIGVPRKCGKFYSDYIYYGLNPDYY